MSEKLKNDIESKNEAIQTESIKLESKRESIANIESKRDSKNNDKVRLDSNGDEIVYEMWHNLSWWDYIIYSIVFFLGIVMVYGGIEAFLFKETENLLVITLLVFGIPATLIGCYCLFYVRKNRFYVTHSGIGFERRKWFRMQKGFYRFGEVGAIESNSFGLFPAKPPSLISIFPLGAIKSKFFFIWQLKPYCTIVLVAWNCYLSQRIYNKASDAYHLHDFLVKKTKEVLEEKGIDTKVLPYDLDKQFDI